MRHTMDRSLVIAMFGLVAAIGCDNRPKDTGLGVASGAAVDSGPAARQAADAFLVALRDYTATPAQLTPALAAAIAPPIKDEDKKLGYSSTNAQEWLAKFRNTNFVVREETKFGNAIVLRGRAEFPTEKEAFTLRMVKDATGYKADWLQSCSYLSTNIASPADPDLAAAQDAVRNMLDLLVGREVRQAQPLMAPEWKKILSPLGSDNKRNDGLEYDPGFLDQTLRAWVRDAMGYSLSDAKLSASRDVATFVAELDVEGKKIPHTVKAKKDPTTGWWLVAGFDTSR